jgi:hypothetical protein
MLSAHERNEIHKAFWDIETGSAPRTPDPLAQFIRNALKSNPELSQNDLLHALRKAHKEGAGVEVDGDRIGFLTARGKPKDVSISVLKDRLSRAKKQMRSKN